MCLAMPMQLMEIKDENGVVELGNIRRKVNLALVSDAETGDYVIVHAGFAISRLDREEAQRTIQLIEQMMETSEHG